MFGALREPGGIVKADDVPIRVAKSKRKSSAFISRVAANASKRRKSLNESKSMSAVFI